MTLLLRGRIESRARQVKEFTESQDATARFYAADFSWLCDERRAAGAIRAENSSIDIVINNAGIGPGATNERQRSQDGYELRLAVTYLSHVLLTELLQPSLSKGARIVNFSLDAQRALDFDDMVMDQGCTGSRA